MEMAESTRTPSEDVVREILLRLDDVATLFRCATACKRWRRLVAKPHFLLRRRWPPPFLVGFFAKRCLGTDDSSSQLAFVPLHGSSLHGTRPRALSSIIHANDAADVVDRAVPLATRSGGLLLVLLYTRDNVLERHTFSLASVCNPIVRLAVCNLLAGTCHVLPELYCQSRLSNSDMYGHDIVPSVADDGSPAFKVLLIGKDKDKSQFNLHTFASGEASWRAPTKCFDMMERQIWSMENTHVVVCGGYAHWLFVSQSNHFHILNVDVETGQVSLTKLLSPTKDWYCWANRDDYDHTTAMARLRDLSGADRLVTTCNGTRLSLCTYRGRRLEIWTQQQEDVHKIRGADEDWLRTREIDHKLTELIQQLERPTCIWSGERSGTLLIREGYKKESVYIADLNTGTLEHATDQFDCDAHTRIMPREIDWSTYFMLSLGGSYRVK